MKKYLCILLAVLMLASLAGCKHKEDDPNETEKPGETSSPTLAPDATADAPDIPTEPPHEPDPDADAAFKELDMEIFRSLVTASTDSYNQYIAHDPAYFGIDRSEVQPGWGDFTYEAHLESMEDARDILAELAAIDRDSLSESNRRAYDVLKREFEVELQYEDYYYYDELLTPLNGMHTLLPLSMFLFNIRSLEDVEDYLLLVGDMARVINEIADFEEEKAAQGLFMCETALDQVLESCRSFAQKGEDSFLITGFDGVKEKAAALGASSAECEAYAARNRELVLNSVLPAYAALANRLEAHRADCSTYVGAAQRGEKAKAYFELAARDEGATMDGMETVTALMDLMGQGTYNAMCFALINGGDEVIDKYYEGAELTFGSVDADLEWLRDFVDEYYPPMPDYLLKYIDIPNDIAEDFSPAAYLQPPFDDYYNNLMLLNPTSESSDDIFTIAHETIPGHMYQFLYTRSLEGVPLSQQIMEPTGYAEAWTVFTEYFVATKNFELGINYCTLLNCENVYFNVYLPAYISIKVNSEGWTYDDVYNMLSAFEVEDAAEIFYEYAVTMPTYAMSYAIGYSYFYDIVKKADPATPEDYKEFFAEYLNYGPMWMDMIRDEMLKG